MTGVTDDDCRACQAPLPPLGRFCSGCGAPVAEAGPAETSHVAVMSDHVDDAGSRRRRWSRIATAAAMVIGAVAVVAVVGLDHRSSGEVITAVRAAPTPTTAPDTAPYSDEELVERFGGAVWRVIARGCGLTSSGTAFAIDQHHLVTNAHVIGVDSNPRLVARSGRRAQGKVIGVSSVRDVAVIRVEEPLDQFLEWAPAAEISEGAHLLGLGYPVPDADFTATPGTAISFQMAGRERQAIRTDAALDRGNSGGPALDTKGRVVGVVTEMATSDGFQDVPLLFSREALGSHVEHFINDPRSVEADCTDTPVEPAAPTPVVTVPAVAPPPTAPVQAPPPTYVVPVFEYPTTTERPCPTGEPWFEITEFIPAQDSPVYLPGWWTVTVRGSVTNGTSADIFVSTIEVDVVADSPTTALGFPAVSTLRPGEATQWEAKAFAVRSASMPTSGSVRGGHSWADFRDSGCGT